MSWPGSDSYCRACDQYLDEDAQCDTCNKGGCACALCECIQKRTPLDHKRLCRREESTQTVCLCNAVYSYCKKCLLIVFDQCDNYASHTIYHELSSKRLCPNACNPCNRPKAYRKDEDNESTKETRET